MALRNPYSAYSRHGDEVDERQALLDALDEPAPPPMQARPRTPVRTPEQTREMLSGPGARTQPAVDTPDVGGNPFSGDRFGDERQEPVYQPPATTPGQTGAQPRTTGDQHTYNPQRGYGLMDKYDDPYTRRMEGSPHAGQQAANWAGTGAMVGGAIVPGAGHVVGGIIGGVAGLIGSAFAKNAETAMTDFRIEDARDMIAAAHKDAFGRDITPEYLDQIVRGQGWEDGDRWMGQDSVAYVLDAFASQAPGDRAAQAAANAAAATPAAGATPAGATGPAPYAMEGFDLQRAQDPSFSVKDAFAAAVRQAPEPPPGQDKAALGEWFKKYAQPFIEAQGHTVNWVEGDKVNITGPQGTGTTDWYRGAGAAGGALAWQPEGGGGGAAGAAGDAPGDIQGAYAYLKSIAHPGMSRAEMESAVAQAFGNVPGFEKAYAGDVVINGRKIDLITNFEGPGASWSDNLSFVPLHGGGGGTQTAGGGAGGGSGVNLAPGAQLASPLGRSDVLAQIQEELNRLLRGEPPRDELLEALG
jgi:hypothetical protein